MEDRLSRWSRLKREARDAETPPERPPEPAPEPASEPAPAAEPDTPPEVLEANLRAAEAVDPATIDETTDMQLFERDGVPDWLRRRAFAALWRSSPVFANVDGLNDYDEDFADPSMVMKTFKSAWQAGRGYLEEVAENVEEEAEAEEDAREPELAEEPVRVAEAPAEPVEEEAQVIEPPAAQVIEPPAEADDAAEPPRVPLRARLAFD